MVVLCSMVTMTMIFLSPSIFTTTSSILLESEFSSAIFSSIPKVPAVAGRNSDARSESVANVVSDRRKTFIEFSLKESMLFFNGDFYPAVKGPVALVSVRFYGSAFTVPERYELMRVHCIVVYHILYDGKSA